MIRLQGSGLRWLKVFHLIAVSCWLGGAVSLLSLYFLKKGVTDGNVLYGINQSIHHADIAIIVIPGALGCLFTGLIYSLFSNWGFFRQPWLIVKWIITVAAILFGTFCLGPWETTMMELSGELGIAAMKNAEYLHNQKMNLIFGTAQALILAITICISVFKPWKKSKA